jgi:hypothetical protein
MPSSWNSSIASDCGTPRQLAITSSNSAIAPAAGWIDRLRPSWPEPPPRWLRSRSPGVMSEPHATTTARARTVSVRPVADRAVTPTARPPSTMIRSARAWVNSSAPARKASGT